MTRPARSRLLAEALAVFALAFAVRAPQLWQEASGDELFHVLAARQWLVDGTFAIHGGEPYERVRTFTLAVAWLFRCFGESLVVARIPAALAGAALAALVFVWLAARGERGAAWIAGALVAFDPELVRLSQMSRFYAPQQLLFLLGAVFAFGAADGTRALAARMRAGALAAACLWAAQEAQVISRIGIGGIALYLALVSAAPLWRWLRLHAVARIAFAGGVLAATALVFYGFQHGWHRATLQLARYVDLWALPNANDWRFYHYYLFDSYPTLWTLFPALTLVALAASPRIALLSACTFAVPFVLHSLMAFKTSRFLAYAFPFLFVVCALALARAVPALARTTERAFARLPADLVPPRLARAAALAAVAMALAFAIVSNNAFVRTARLIVADPSYRDSITVGKNETLSWARAARELAPRVAAADAVVVSEDVKALYYLGRADFVINRDHLFEDLPVDGEPRPEFAVDPKIDVPIVSEPASIDRIARCYGTGIIVAQTGFLQAPWIVPAETRAHLLSRFERVPLPDAWGVTALRWSTAQPAKGPECVLRAKWPKGRLE